MSQQVAVLCNDCNDLFLLLFAHRASAHSHCPAGRRAQNRLDAAMMTTLILKIIEYIMHICILRVGGSGGVACEGLGKGSPVVKVLGLPHVSRAPAALNRFLFNFLEKKFGRIMLAVVALM